MQALIRRHWPVVVAWEGNESHRSLEDLPHEHRGKPIFTLLRNPWDWYVSWFTYCSSQSSNPEFLLNVSGDPPSFEDTISNLLRPQHTDPVITEFMKRERIGLQEMHRFHILDLENERHDIRYGRLEQVKDDFMNFLDDHEIDAPLELADSLSGEPVNRSKHGPWTAAYSPALRNKVKVTERRIIALGNYRFEL